MKTELIVHFDKNLGAIGLIFFPLLFIAALFLLVLINSFKTSIGLPYFSYVLIPFQVIIGFSLAIIAFGWFLLLMQMIDKRPIAILNKQGVLTKRNSLIPWQHIEAIYPYAIGPDAEHLPLTQAKRIAVGIKIKKDTLSLDQKQSSF